MTPDPKVPPLLLPRAYYAATLEAFLLESSDSVLGKLTAASEASVEPDQRDAWLGQIEVLRKALTGLSGWLFFEFTIPRMGRRIDAVVISGGLVLVLEFKVGEAVHRAADKEQAWDYALDLKNFHKASHGLAILPILVATDSGHSDEALPGQAEDGVWEPLLTNAEGLRRAMDLGLAAATGALIDAQAWAAAPYHPTPTIVEAARSLYANHTVEAITRQDAGATNLRVTSGRIEELVDRARGVGHKVICFVTGVPGAGKTLVGLNVATRRGQQDLTTHAVFLSGNGPLVAVLREALTRDEVQRRRGQGEKVRKGKVGESVKAFIQNVHHFRDEALRDPRPPIDHVVIFDEAQRAWNLQQTSSFMQRKKGRAGFAMSEPEFLLSYLDRHQEWAVVICLVGGGQEINTGEAGIGAWLEAVQRQFPDWLVFISPGLSDSEFAAGPALAAMASRPNVSFERDLHLAVSMRSFRAENVSAFVKAVLDCEVDQARQAFGQLQARYPVRLTRSLDLAREWTRRQARGSERFGLVASSGAQRLKPHAIDVRVEIDPVKWFLNDRDDTRSSYYLEDAATEFQVQGLELDWACVTWDADLRFGGGSWGYHSFKGSNWQNIHKAERRTYLKNAYRVLLTRARQGMVIFVPEGVTTDPTRKPEYYDQTFAYLRDLGIPVLG